MSGIAPPATFRAPSFDAFHVKRQQGEAFIVHPPSKGAVLGVGKFCAMIGIGIVIAFAMPSFAAEKITIQSQNYSVIDGDSIEVDGTVYNLNGIDAPELGQICDHGGHLSACGLTAAYELRKQLELQPKPIDCWVKRAAKVPTVTCMALYTEISVSLLKDGAVTALPDSSPHYATAEKSARDAALGIWGSKFIPPAQWRRGKRLPVEHDYGALPRLRGVNPWKFEGGAIRRDTKRRHMACLVKGVVTKNNKRFYYGPLDKNFDAIKIDPKKGERFFCGDDNARQAGWRREGEKPASGG